MIKAKKSLIITLFAAMMVFAFGATMSFAADDSGIVWDPAKNFTEADYNGNTYQADWVFGSDGITVATVQVKSDGVVIKESKRYFIDFTGATIVSANPIRNQSYVDLNGQYATITLKNPGNGATGPTSVKKVFNSTLPTVTYKTDTKIATTGGEAKIEAEIKAGATGNGKTKEDPAILGSIDAKTVTVKGVTADTTTYGWTAINGNENVYDGTKIVGTNGTSLTVKYDGKENTIVSKDVAGYSKKYQVRNDATGKWSDVSAITYYHVGDPVTYRTVYTPIDPDGDKGTLWNGATPTLTLTVAPAAKIPSVAWTSGNNTDGKAYQDFYITKAQAADPTAFLEFSNELEGEDVSELDMDAIKAYFNDVYAISDVVNTADASLHTWKIVAKTLSTTEVRAVAKTHAQLIADYNLNEAKPALNVLTGDGVSVKIIDGDSELTNTKADDITFTMAPNKVTYKAKKLKKAKSFTVEAVAESGNAITYIMTSPSKKISIDPATGKVTVKKLKKGTYKVKIKAKTAAGNGYAAAKESVSVKIKVKK